MTQYESSFFLSCFFVEQLISRPPVAISIIRMKIIIISSSTGAYTSLPSSASWDIKLFFHFITLKNKADFIQPKNVSAQQGANNVHCSKTLVTFPCIPLSILALLYLNFPLAFLINSNFSYSYSISIYLTLYVT